VRIVWTSQAEQDRESIVLFIAENDVTAAMTMDDAMAEAARRLTAHPRSGRPGRVPGTRELVFHEHYLLVYEIDAAKNTAGTLVILTVLHTSRQWP